MDALISGGEQAVILNIKPEKAGFYRRDSIEAYVAGGTLPSGKVFEKKPNRREVKRLIDAGFDPELPSDRPSLHYFNTIGRSKSDAVRAMAIYMGIDPNHERELVPLADEALEATLPPGWFEFVNSSGCILYFNAEAMRARRTHPAEAYFLRVLERARARRRAELHYQTRVLANRFQRWEGYAKLSRQAKKSKRLVEIHTQIVKNWGRMLMRVQFNSWIEYCDQCAAEREQERRQFKAAVGHWRYMRKHLCFEQWKAFMRLRWSEQAKVALAGRHWMLVHGAKAWKAWRCMMEDAEATQDRADERRFEVARAHWRRGARLRHLLAWRRRSEGRYQQRAHMGRAARIWRRYWLKRALRKWHVYCWKTDHGVEHGLREAQAQLELAKERAKRLGTGRLRATRDLGKAEGALHKALVEQRRLEASLQEERQLRKDALAEAEALAARLTRSSDAEALAKRRAKELEEQLAQQRKTNVELRDHTSKLLADYQRSEDSELGPLLSASGSVIPPLPDNAVADGAAAPPPPIGSQPVLSVP